MNAAIPVSYQRAVDQLRVNAHSGGGGGSGRIRDDRAAATRYAAFNDSLRSSAVFNEPSHETLQTLFAQLPFSATRASDDIHPVRAALSDALREKGRDAEADLAGDPTKKLRPVYHDHASGWHLEEQPHVDENIASTMHLPSNVRHYLNAALWSETFNAEDDDDNRDGEPLDHHFSGFDFSKDAMERAHHDVQRFYSMLSPRALEAVYEDEDQAAHDLWLTRQGHGAGFWDGNWDHHGEGAVWELTNAAKKLGEQYIDVEHHGDSDPDRDGEYTLHLHGGR